MKNVNISNGKKSPIFLMMEQQENLGERKQIGVIVGCVLSTYLKYSSVLLCLAYIGSVDLVLNLFDLINKG